MRHRRNTNHLSRNAPHARTVLRNMAASVLEHEQVTTTVEKAKAAQPFIEQMITLGKAGHLTARRRAIALLGSDTVTRRLFRDIAPLFASRQGGYTRIIRLGMRRGDGASLALLELTERLPVATPETPAKIKRRRETPAAPESPRETAKPKPTPPTATVAPPPGKTGGPPPPAKPRKLLDGLRTWWGRRQGDRGSSSR